MNVIELRDALNKLVVDGHGAKKVVRYTEEVHHSPGSHSYIAVHMWKEVKQGKLDEDGLKLL